MVICCIRLLCDLWFYFCHRIVYIYYFLASYLSSPWYDWFLWRCFVQPLGEILFLSKFPFLSHVQVLSCEMLFISRLKRPWIIFFLFLFPSYCHSVVYRVISIVSNGRNQSSFVFFYVVFELLYRCVNVVFDAGKSSSSLFSWYVVSRM